MSASEPRIAVSAHNALPTTIGNLRRRELPPQAVLHMLDDGRNVARDVAELVDAIDEDGDALLVEPAQNAQQGNVGG